MPSADGDGLRCVAGSAAGYHPSAHVATLVLMLAGGGRTLEDLRILRRDTGQFVIDEVSNAHRSQILVKQHQSRVRRQRFVARRQLERQNRLPARSC